MSHNVTMKGVRINDLALLGNAAVMLSNGQAKLVPDAKTFRTYRGQPNDCDAKIAMPGKHDIGLKRDGSYYVPVFDPYNMDPIFKHRGAARGGSNHIGLLLQEYSLQEAEILAAQRGMSATRVPGKDGTVTLEMVEA